MDGKTEAERFVGIDVGKARVEVHVRPDGRVFGGTTEVAGLSELVAWLTPWQPRQVVLEASGGDEAVVAAVLTEAGLPVAIVNPRQGRKFAGAIGRLAKTDAIDAAVLAHFAEAIPPAPRPLPAHLSRRLRELLGRRHQLVIMINAERQRLARAEDPIARRSFKALLESLEGERARIDRAPDKLIAASPALVRQAEPAQERPRHPRRRRPHADRRAARARPGRPSPDRRPGRGGADQPRQRPLPGPAPRPGRAGRGPGALHGVSGRDPAQPAAARLLPSPARRRQAGQACPGSRSCANCSPSSTPCSATSAPGRIPASERRADGGRPTGREVKAASRVPRGRASARLEPARTAADPSAIGSILDAQDSRSFVQIPWQFRMCATV